MAKDRNMRVMGTFVVFKIMGPLAEEECVVSKGRMKELSPEYTSIYGRWRRSGQQGSLMRTDCFLRRWEEAKGSDFPSTK